MVKDIGETESTSEHIAIYYLYKLLPEMSHNSYFFAGQMIVKKLKQEMLWGIDGRTIILFRDYNI